VLTVRPVNFVPTLSPLANQTTTEGTPVSLSLTIGDRETPADKLLLSASSSNPTLLPLANIHFSGSGPNRAATLAPAPGQAGLSTVIITVSDGTSTKSQGFILTVNAINHPPV